MLSLLIGYGAVAVTFYFVGHVRGYYVGIGDTEKRWSEAVNRAEERRKWDSK